MKFTIFKDFIKEYYNENEYFAIFLLNNKDPDLFKKHYMQDCKTILKYEDYLTRNNIKQASIYLSINTFKDNTNRKKGNIKAIKALFFDFDDEKNGKTQYELKEELIEKLGPPTYEIQTSPSKYQLLYKFKETLGGNDIKEFETISKTLINHFKADHQVYDTSRLFRCPGSINKKNDFQTIFKKSDTQYTLEYFKNFIEKNNITLENIQDKEKGKS